MESVDSYHSLEENTKNIVFFIIFDIYHIHKIKGNFWFPFTNEQTDGPHQTLMFILVYMYILLICEV